MDSLLASGGNPTEMLVERVKEYAGFVLALLVVLIIVVVWLGLKYKRCQCAEGAKGAYHVEGATSLRPGLKEGFAQGQFYQTQYGAGVCTPGSSDGSCNRYSAVAGFSGSDNFLGDRSGDDVVYTGNSDELAQDQASAVKQLKMDAASHKEGQEGLEASLHNALLGR